MTRPLFPPRGGGDIRLPPVFEANVSHPMIDDFSMRAQRQRARAQPPGIPSMFPLPLRNHPMWSGNNELGREVTFAPDSNNTQMVLKLDEWGPPEVWSVMLGMEFDETTFTGVNAGFEVLCSATIGCGGITQQVTMDWFKGTSFSATMNALNIVAIYNAALVVPDGLRLRATVSKGKLTDLPPQRTQLFSAPGAGLSSIIPIPFFAKNVRLTARANALAEVYAATNSVNFYGNLNPISIQAQIPADSFRYFDGCPFPGFAKYIAYSNTNAASGGVSGDFIFDLSL